MVSVADVIGLGAILLVNSTITALMMRFFRVRLATTWGGFLYTALFAPVALLLATLVLSGVLGLGPNLGSRAVVAGVTLVIPLSLGVAFDYYWMPSPDDVELPEEYEST